MDTWSASRTHHESLAVLYFLLKLLFLKPVHSAGSLLDDIFVYTAQCRDWLLWVNAEQNDSLRIDQQYPMVKCLSEVCLSTFYTSLKTKQNSHSKACFKTRVHAKSCFACPVLQCRMNYLALLFDSPLCSKGLFTWICWGKGPSSFTNQYKVIDKSPKASERQFINRKVRWTNDWLWWTSSTE